MSLYRTVLGSFKWSVLGELVSKTVGPIVLVVLAKILLPDDFGIVAAATIVISFSQVFWDAGLAKTLIQRKQRVAESATVVFWINVVSGTVLFVILLFTADPIAQFFDDERIADVIRVLAVQLPLAAACSVHIALEQKEFQFKRLFWVRVATTATPALASIPLAMNGYGYWALVIGTLLGQVAQVIVLWAMSSWRPALWFETALAKELFRFGRWVMLSALLSWFFIWVDALIVGGFLGIRELGLYRTGDAFVTLIFGLLAAPLLPVLYSLFCELAGDMHRLRKTVMLLDRTLMSVVLPAGAGLLVLRDLIPDLIFTAEWQDIGLIIGIIGMTQALSYTVSVKQQVYKAIGRPEVETQIMVISMLIRVLFYSVSVQFGLLAFVWARFLSTIVGVINHLIFAHRMIGIDFRRYFGDLIRVLPAVLIMYFVGRRCQEYLAPNMGVLLQAMILIATCSFTYAAITFVTQRRLVTNAYALLTGKEAEVVAHDNG
jgi:PST family polysaccharide transporter